MGTIIADVGDVVRFDVCSESGKVTMDGEVMAVLFGEFFIRVTHLNGEEINIGLKAELPPGHYIDIVERA